MARRTNISEIPDLNPDEAIMLVRGVLTKIYERKSGTNSNGEWSIQNAEIKDDSGTIKVMFKDRQYPIPDTYKGKEVVIESYHGDKGYSGVYAYDDSFTPSRGPNAGKTTNSRIIKVTATGVVGLADDPNPGDRTGAPNGGAKPQPQSQPPRQQSAPAPQPQSRPASNGGGQAQPQPAPAPAADGDEKAIKRALMRDALYLALCVKAAAATVLPAMVEACQGASEETVQKLATTLFIQGCRRGDNDKMPTPKKASPAAPAPEPEPEPEPPRQPQRQQHRQMTNAELEEADDIPF